MRLGVTAFLLFVVAALGVVVVFAVRLLDRDRAALLDRFAADRAHQLDEALAEIEGDFEDISDDLHLAARLASDGDELPETRRRELGALVAVERGYELVELRDATGQVIARAAKEPSFTADPAVERALAETAADARSRSGRVVASRAVAGTGRVFSVSDDSGGQPVVASLLVDTQPILAKLRIASAGPGNKLVVLGAYGAPTPASDAELAGALNSGRRIGAGFAAMTDRLRARAAAEVRLPAREARALGLGDLDLVAVIRPIPIAGGAPWSVALVASTAAISAHERAIVRRMIEVVVLIAGILAVLGAFVILQTRRTIRLSERLRSADALAHLREKSEKILDTIPTGVVAVGDDNRVGALNDALRRRVGEGVVGRPLAALFPDGAAGAVEQLVALVDSARASGEPRSVFGQALRLFGADGTYNLHAVPLAARFADASVLLVIEDLSMIGSLEQQLVRSEKLATVGVLAAGIAHEIGTPLGVARGRAEYMLGKLSPDEPRAADARQIVEQIDQVSRTFRRLLDFARMKPSTARLATDAGDLAASVVELLRLEAERRQVTLEVDVAPGVPPVAADAEQLEQVLVNLVMNAMDACDGGGRVTVSAELAEVSPPAVRIAVADDGRGIADEDQGQVFDPFFTTKKRGKGTGLGLAIVAQVARDHGATVELDSRPEEGTRVTLVWPAARAASSESRSHAG